MQVFWKQGYDATSLKDLTDAMGISPPSLYAAFGNKQALFLEAVSSYAATHGAYIQRALQEPTAAEAIERLLRTAAKLFSDPKVPSGCFIVLGALNCTPASAEVEDELRKMRRDTERRVLERLRTGQEEGDLADDADPRAIAAFVSLMLNGMSIKARDGAKKRELDRMVDIALCGLKQMGVSIRGRASCP